MDAQVEVLRNGDWVVEPYPQIAPVGFTFRSLKKEGSQRATLRIVGHETDRDGSIWPKFAVLGVD